MRSSQTSNLGQPSKNKDYVDRIYKREMELIRQGQDCEVAHAIAVAEDALPKLEKLKKK